MKIPKPTDADKDRFRDLVPDSDPRVTIKPMFGNLAAFVNGNMFMGLFGPEVGVRLADDDREALAAKGGGEFGPADRPMREYVTLPAAWLEQTKKAEPWIEKALANTAAMPPKKPKKKK